MRSIIIISILLFIFPKIIHGQEIIATTQGSLYGTALYIYKNDSSKNVFEETNWICQNNNIKSTPDGSYLGAIARTRELVKDEKGNEYIGHMLLIFNPAGKLLKTLPNVIQFAWSPDCKQIVYIEAKGDLEDYYYLIPKTLKTYQIVTDKIISFYPGGYADIAWANHDSMIYYTDLHNVYKINPHNKEKVKVDYHGIYFSSDGKYYFNLGYEAPLKLYESKTNREIKIGDMDEDILSFGRWIDKYNLVVGHVYDEKKIIDVRNGEAIIWFTGEMFGYNSKTKEIYVYKDKKIFKELDDSKIQKIKIPR